MKTDDSNVGPTPSLADSRQTAADYGLDKDNQEMMNAANLIEHSNHSVFLTGKAGTGKSTFIKYVCRHTRKKHIVLAPTGIAAVNAGGVTLHSFFQLPFHPLLPDDPKYSLKGGKLYEAMRYNSEKRNIIRDVELIIIDEISMVRADIIDFIDKILRVYSHCMRLPFGGKQLLFVGDMFQLEPVVTGDERDILRRFYPNNFFFSAHVFQTMPLVSIELQKVYRQQDRVFVSVLNHIRSDQATSADLQLLNMRYQPYPVDDGKMRITLATRRDRVNQINEGHLNALPGEAVCYEGTIKGEFPDRNLPTQMQLRLKIGAQVIFVRNDPERRWVNGTIAQIADMGESAVIVETEDGERYDVEREMWENVRYSYNEKEHKIEEEQLGTFVQFPLRLAWALTVHKSQGLTFKNVIIDLTGGVFAGGQTYVALSRCTSLEGIILRQPVSQGDIFVRREIMDFSRQFNDSRLLNSALKASKADIEYAAAVEAYNNGNFEDCLNHFFIAIHARYDIEKPLPRRYIRRKLNLINDLRQQNKQLIQKMKEQEKFLTSLSKEYVAMGNECAAQIDDPRAAIANYDKAIRLDAKNAEAWKGKGRVQLKRSPKEASKSLKQAVAINPLDEEAIYLRGLAALALGKNKAARDLFNTVLDLNVEHADAHEQLGNALSALGDDEQAELHWTIAKELRKQKP